MAGKRVTLRDVAAAAGVSRATAGFVLSDAPGMAISQATRDRVRQTARDLGYVPHGIARALREGSSRIVVLNFIAGNDGNYSRSFTRGLDEELAAHGYVLLVRHGPADPGAEQAVLDAISPRAVLRLGENYLHPGHELDDGGWNGGLAGNTAVQLKYLADRGHTRIAIAIPEGDLPLPAVRLDFAREAADKLGLPPLAVLAVPSARADVTSAVKAFLAAHDGITAVAALEDDIALRILAALRDLELTAPDDLAVMGFDDIEYGAFAEPALTTVRIDAADHGRKTARVILGLDGEGFLAAPATVIVRESA